MDCIPNLSGKDVPATSLALSLWHVFPRVYYLILASFAIWIDREFPNYQMFANFHLEIPSSIYLVPLTFYYISSKEKAGCNLVILFENLLS